MNETLLTELYCSVETGCEAFLGKGVHLERVINCTTISGLSDGRVCFSWLTKGLASLHVQGYCLAPQKDLTSGKGTWLDMTELFKGIDLAQRKEMHLRIRPTVVKYSDEAQFPILYSDTFVG